MQKTQKSACERLDNQDKNQDNDPFLALSLSNSNETFDPSLD